jgi:uncharacterized protein DUF4760
MSSIGSKTISLKIPVNWLWGIAGFAVALIAAFIFIPEPTKWRPVLVFAAAVVAGAAGLITAINNIDQRAALSDKAEEAAQQQRVGATLDLFYRWNAPEFAACKNTGREIRDYFRANPKVDDQLAYLKSDLVRLHNLLDILNTFEALNIAIDKRVADEPTAKLFFRAIVVEYWHQADDVIRKIRAEHNNARLYKEFESLYNRWKA